jgi:hypothetical protein
MNVFSESEDNEGLPGGGGGAGAAPRHHCKKKLVTPALHDSNDNKNRYITVQKPTYTRLY